MVIAKQQLSKPQNTTLSKDMSKEERKEEGKEVNK